MNEPKTRIHWLADVPEGTRFSVEPEPSSQNVYVRSERRTGMSVWQPLSLLREGSIFVTQDGVYAVKTEYANEGPPYQNQCVLLESGEYAYFPQGNRTPVREVKLSREEERMQFLVEAVASLQMQDYTLSEVASVWNDDEE